MSSPYFPPPATLEPSGSVYHRTTPAGGKTIYLRCPRPQGETSREVFFSLRPANPSVQTGVSGAFPMRRHSERAIDIPETDSVVNAFYGVTYWAEGF
jgi:hypothetical protein